MMRGSSRRRGGDQTGASIHKHLSAAGSDSCRIFLDVALDIDDRVHALYALVADDALPDGDPLLVQAIVMGSTAEDDYTRSAMWAALAALTVRISRRAARAREMAVRLALVR
jgi:hypothetical protein